MKKFINFLLGINVWVLFLLSVLGAVLFSVLLGLLLNALFHDGTNNLIMLGAVLIPAIDAPVFIALLIILIRELRRLRSELDQRVEERTRELQTAYQRLRREIRERKEVERRLMHAHKMESIGTLAGGIAHDFNNILSAVLGYTELSLDEAEEGSRLARNLREVHIAGTRARDLVKQILTFARQSDEMSKPVQVGAVAREVLKLLRSSIPATIEIRSRIESDSPILGDPVSIHQVLMNLCTNAAQAMEGGGVLDVALADAAPDEVRRAVKNPREGTYVQLTVSDTGAGIPEEHLESIFEPYFTTKAVGEGTGMGLAVVHGIVKKCGGEILVESRPGEGSRFTVFLPATEEDTSDPVYEPRSLPPGTEHILFVDDELPIVGMAQLALSSLGYSVTPRTSSVEALALFASRPDDFDLVITDMTMPNMTGDQLAVELMKIRPDLPVILCTGYSRQVTPRQAAELGVRKLLYKPIIKADLAAAVRSALDETKP